MSQPGPRWPRFASPGSCLSRAVTRVSGMRARSDVCSEMRLAMMPPVLTNGLSLLCDSRQRWKKPMRSLAAPLSPGSCTQPPPRASPGGQGSSYQPGVCGFWCTARLWHSSGTAPEHLGIVPMVQAASSLQPLLGAGFLRVCVQPLAVPLRYTRCCAAGRCCGELGDLPKPALGLGHCLGSAQPPFLLF